MDSERPSAAVRSTDPGRVVLALVAASLLWPALSFAYLVIRAGWSSPAFALPGPTTLALAARLSVFVGLGTLGFFLTAGAPVWALLHLAGRRSPGDAFAGGTLVFAGWAAAAALSGRGQEALSAWPLVGGAVLATALLVQAIAYRRILPGAGAQTERV